MVDVGQAWLRMALFLLWALLTAEPGAERSRCTPLKMASTCRVPISPPLPPQTPPSDSGSRHVMPFLSLCPLPCPLPCFVLHYSRLLVPCLGQPPSGLAGIACALLLCGTCISQSHLGTCAVVLCWKFTCNRPMALLQAACPCCADTHDLSLDDAVRLSRPQPEKAARRCLCLFTAIKFLLPEPGASCHLGLTIVCV